MSRIARDADQLLLGEWACLAVLASGPSHGFAISARLRPDSDLGRIWSLSRPLTYRALEQLAKNRLIESVGEEPGLAGGTRTIYSITPTGRRALVDWLDRPALHLRDLRSELLLKLHVAPFLEHDLSGMVGAQLDVVRDIERHLRERLDVDPNDLVARWRLESATAAARFLDDLIER